MMACYRPSSSFSLPLLLVCSVFLLSSRQVLAAAPTSFCKCTCFGNSTIISLGGQPDGAHTPQPPPLPPPALAVRAIWPFLKRASMPEDDDAVLPPPDPKHPDDHDHKDHQGDDGGDPKKKHPPKKSQTGGNCSECNRKFCLSYRLPICRGAREEDVFTTCFQRDSRKDQAVVLIFIVTTGGLLIWAGIRRWILVPKGDDRREYIPVPTTANTGDQ